MTKKRSVESLIVPFWSVINIPILNNWFHEYLYWVHSQTIIDKGGASWQSTEGESVGSLSVGLPSNPGTTVSDKNTSKRSVTTHSHLLTRYTQSVVYQLVNWITEDVVSLSQLSSNFLLTTRPLHGWQIFVRYSLKVNTTIVLILNLSI